MVSPRERRHMHRTSPFVDLKLPILEHPDDTWHPLLPEGPALSFLALLSDNQRVRQRGHLWRRKSQEMEPRGCLERVWPPERAAGQVPQPPRCSS